MIRRTLPAVLLVASGCATPFADDRFPTRAALDEIAQRPLPPAKPRQDPATVTEWQLTGPFPDRFADALVAQGNVGAALEKVVPGRSSESMVCAARELGLFLRVNKQRPEPLLEQRMLGRCGASSSSFGYFTMEWTSLDDDMMGDAGETKMLEHADVKRWLVASAGRGRVGAAVVRDGREALVVCVYAVPAVSLESSTQIAANGAVRVAGAVDGKRRFTNAMAQITQGALGVADCVAEQGAVLPRFAFLCPVGADDDTATIAIAGWEEGRVLGRALATLVVLPKGASDGAKQFKRVAYVEPKPLPSAPEQVGPALLAAANELRVAQGLTPFEPAAGQDKLARQLAGHYFANDQGDDDDKANDLIALGLLAGWEVKSTVIGDGDFNSLVAYGSGLHDVLASALAAPSTRAQLLRKESTVASIAAEPVGTKGVGLLISSYEPLSTPNQVTNDRVFESLRAARRNRGVSDLMILPVGGAEQRAVERIRGGQDPNQVFNAALREAVDSRGNGLRGLIVQTQDVDRIAWPDELLTTRSTSVAVGVAAYKHPAAAWGSLIVIVIAEIDDVQVAVATR